MITRCITYLRVAPSSFLDMTNNMINIRRSGALVGLLGEYLAAEQLRELGWAVTDVFGGQHRHFDQRAVSPHGCGVQVSVKTSTRVDGALAYQRPGLETVAPWMTAAAAVGEQAIVLGLHVEPVARIERIADGFFVPTPRVIECGALDATTWGREVDRARAAYGARPRKDGRGLLSPNGLRYPLTVHEMAWLHDVLRRSQ